MPGNLRSGIVASTRTRYSVRVILDLDPNFPPASVPAGIRGVVSNTVLYTKVVGNFRVDSGEILNFAGGIHTTTCLIGNLPKLLSCLFVGLSLAAGSTWVVGRDPSTEDVTQNVNYASASLTWIIFLCVQENLV